MKRFSKLSSKSLSAIGLALSLAGTVADVRSSRSAEYALGIYQLGAGIPLSGVTPAPGFYFEDTVFAYHGTASPSLNLPFGRNVVSGVTERFLVNATTVSWFSPQPVAGGTFGLAGTVPYGNISVDADVALSGPQLGTRELNRSDSTTGFGQPVVSAILGWQQDVHHWNVTTSVFIPAGTYHAESLSLVSLNRPSFDIKGAYTYLDTKTGTELSGAVGMTFNLPNPATDYLTGLELHLEGAWQHHFANGFSLGVGGYFYQQITGDSGSGARLGSFEGRVAALGPLFGYTFKVHEIPVSLSARAFWEFGTENRVPGQSVFGSVSFPLYVYPSKTATAKPLTARY